MNDFYKQPKVLVWIESILFLFIGFVLGILILDKGYDYPLIYSAFILYIPVSQFLFTPIYKLTGGYTYYSPMLLGYMANEKQIDLHSGTSFDHFFVLRKYKAGTTLRNSIMMYHLEGLLNIISLIENKRIPDSVNIIGTSYFFKLTFNKDVVSYTKVVLLTKTSFIGDRFNILLSVHQVVRMLLGGARIPPLLLSFIILIATIVIFCTY
jgi:hypothetical protein